MIDLTRRRFLKWVGLGALAAVVPIPSKTVKAGPLTERDKIPVGNMSIASRKVEFDPDFEYGRATQIRRLDDKSVIQCLHQDARRVLPEGTPYDLRAELCKRGRFRVAWYYSPRFMGREMGLYGTRVEDGPYSWKRLRHDEPYVPPRGIKQDSWKWIPEYGVWMRGVFYA